MKILQVVKFYYPQIGGVEKIVQQISEGLNPEDDFNVSVLCCNKGKENRKDVISGVSVISASSFGVFWGMPVSLIFFRLFRKLIKENDVIDYHYPFPLIDLAIFLFKPKNKLIVHYHSDIVRQRILNFLIKPLTLNTLKKADKIIVSNPNIVKSSPYLSRFKEKCEIIPFGVNFQKIEKVNEDQTQKIKNKYKDFILFVGRLNYYKGVRYLVRAMKNVNSNLVIIGEGQQENFLRREVERLKIKEKVFFLPFVKTEELISFYKTCKVFVLPSIFKSEAFGIVLIEAMACGAPLISTELGTGTSFVNKNKTTGFVVSPRNEEELSSAINKIIDNKKMAQEMRVNSIERAKELFSLEGMIQKTKKVYENL